MFLPTRRRNFRDFLGLPADIGGWPDMYAVEPIPFRLSSDGEKETMVEAFGKLLNGLNRSVQFLSLSVPFEWRGQMGVPAGLGSLNHAVRRFVERLCRDRQMLGRRLYVVIQDAHAHGDLELYEGLRRLDRHPEEVDWYEQLGSIAELLDPPNLVARDRGDIGDEVPDWEWACPGSLQERALEMEVGEHRHRTLYIAGYPSQVRPGWFAPLLDLPCPGSVSIHVHPVPGDASQQLLQRRTSELKSSVRLDAQRGRDPDPDLAAALEDSRRLQGEVARAEQRLFRVGTYFGLQARTLGQLEQADTRLRAMASGAMLSLRPARFQMEGGLLSTLPLASDRLMRHHVFQTSAAASLFPFAGSGLLNRDGIFMGLDTSSGSPVVLDRFRLANCNSLVLAQSGAGKSYFSKLEVLRTAAGGTPVYVIDPEGEYSPLGMAAGGRVIHGPTPYAEEDLDCHLVIFDLSKVERERRAAATHKALQVAWEHAVTHETHLGGARRLLVLDEAWLLLGDRRFLSDVVEIAKTSRKRLVGFACVSQDLLDLLRFPEAESVVTNASLKVLLRQSPHSIDRLASSFHLSEGERRLLLTAPVGEGVLIADDHRVPFRALACPEEEALIRTGFQGGDA